MSTVNEIREGFSRAWDSIANGWHELHERASDALTRFHPKTPTDDQESVDDRIISRASRWGLLAAEISDCGDSLEVSLEVPGLDPGDFDIEVNNDVLIVRGEKKVCKNETQGRYHVMERAYGLFERALQLPVAVKDEHANASYRAGVLTVHLPKANTPGGRRITVET